MDDQQIKQLRKTLIDAFKKEYARKELEVSTPKNTREWPGARIVCPDAVVEVWRTSPVPTYTVQIYLLSAIASRISRKAQDCLMAHLTNPARIETGVEGNYGRGDKTLESDLVRLVPVIKKVNHAVNSSRDALDVELEKIFNEYKR